MTNTICRQQEFFTMRCWNPLLAIVFIRTPLAFALLGRFAALTFAVGTALLCVNSALAQQAYFMGLGNLPGGAGFVSGISGDGSIIVGTKESGDPNSSEVFRWTRASGIVGLGLRRATYISNDGSTIVAQDKSGKYYRWRQGTGPILLPTPPSSEPVGLTADGSTIAFSGSTWTESGGFANSPGGMRIAHISADGSVFTGWSFGGRQTKGVIWSQQLGVVECDQPLPDGRFLTDPRRISADGTVVIGQGARWEPATGVVDLVPAVGLSANGSVTVGGDSIWQKSLGKKNLQDMLASEYGLASQLAGWSLSYASEVSNDGRTIAGSGTNPAGQFESWVAFLGSPVPEPSALVLAALAILPMTTRRRRGRSPFVRIPSAGDAHRSRF